MRRFSACELVKREKRYWQAEFSHKWFAILCALIYSHYASIELVLCFSDTGDWLPIASRRRSPLFWTLPGIWRVKAHTLRQTVRNGRWANNINLQIT